MSSDTVRMVLELVRFRHGEESADALGKVLSSLSSPPAPSVPPSPTVEPSKCPSCGSPDPLRDIKSETNGCYYNTYIGLDSYSVCRDLWHDDTPPTPVAAPTPAAPTSEARPTHVRVTDSMGFKYTEGKVYPVMAWSGTGVPQVASDTGQPCFLNKTKWEPAAKPTTPAADEADGIDGPYTEAVRLAELMLDPENQPPQYGANEGWRLFSDALARARAGRRETR